ncbi:hypothetical protein ACTFIW_001121 [Dictyostelium discoideum]
MIKSFYCNVLIVLFIGLIGCIFASSPTTISVTPGLVENSNDQVTISWSGIVKPTTNDIVAIYSPSTASVTHPWGYIKLSQSSSWKSGSGSVSLPLLNVRSDYIFRIWSPVVNSSSPILNIFPNVTLTLLATSTAVTFKNPNAPDKSSLAFTNSTSEMRLMWISGTNDSPICYYSSDPNSLSNSVTGITVTYAISDMCASPANDTNYFRNPGYIHDVVMTGLLPNTTYYYYFGSENDGMSAIQSFLSPPDNSDPSNSEAFVIGFGDLGTTFPYTALVETQYPASETIAAISQTISAPYGSSPFVRAMGKQSNSIDRLDPSQTPFWSVHHIGDISYARGKAFIWDYFMDSMQPIVSKVPYMVSIGNHEYDFIGQPFAPSWSNYGSDSGGECGVPYSKRFHMTGAEDSTRNLWFSYENGPIHFTVMSAEHDFLPGSPQFEWLNNDLASVDREKTPWVVFSGHRPLYSSALPEDSIGSITALREAIEPLFQKYDVDMALWGHVHIYERTCGFIGNFTCADNDNDGTVHVIIGMAGNTYSVPWEGSDISSGNGHEDEPEWSIFRSISYGHVRFYANTTSLYFEFVGNHRSIVHDSFWLNK